MLPKNLLIKEFSFALPSEKIAQFPLASRDSSKLLIYKNGKIEEDFFANVDNYLPKDSLLIFNDTKVINARILFKKATGATVEIFCLEPGEYDDAALVKLPTPKVIWKCLIGGAKKFKENNLSKKVKIENAEIELKAKIIEKLKEFYLVELSWNDNNITFFEILQHAGKIPIPPYLKRNAEIADIEQYQTIYAMHNGSVAAPTAGLHFTKSVFEKLSKKNIHKIFTTLHVGAGTFKPVKSETVKEHEMHAELISVERKFIETLLKHYIDKNKIVAVGTTSLRTIESLYWLGLKLKLQPDISPNKLMLTQWEAYELCKEDFLTNDALQTLLQWMQKNNLETVIARTKILIAPGYEIKIADGLITNFHLPQSTLLLLIAAFVGDDWKNIYNYALQNNFRFLSYGDGSLLWKL